MSYCVSGGDLHEDVRDDVEGYIKNNTGERVAFDVWNGDALAHLLLSGVLRENSLPETWRSDFRKAVAMVDEPEIGFGHFSRFVNSIADSTRATRPKRLTSIRQIYVGLWTLYVWAREAGNLEAAYLCSEYALLLGWSLAKEHLVGTSRAARQLRQSVDRLITLHQAVADDYLDRYVEPRARTMHGVCAAVPSHVSLDVNLRMFDLVGRVGMRGLWQLFVAERLHMGNDEKGKESARGCDSTYGTSAYGRDQQQSYSPYADQGRSGNRHRHCLSLSESRRMLSIHQRLDWKYR